MTAINSKFPGFDVVIIGGGPAGISAAVWCNDLGLSCSLLERGSSLGGQLEWIHAKISNYPGIEAENGREMLARFEQSLASSVVRQLNVCAASIDAGGLGVSLDDGRQIAARAIILATGIRRRRLGILGEAEFIGRGVLDSGSKARHEVAGKNVVIVGGGDAALENAVMLSESASKVTLIHRRREFSARQEFADCVRDLGNVEMKMGSELISINGDEVIRSVTCRPNDGGQPAEIPADAVLIRIGVEPNSEIVRDIVAVDARGYVIVDRNCMSSAKNIFAIGDVSNPTAPTIAAAVGDGATAAKAALSLLSAS